MAKKMKLDEIKQKVRDDFDVEKMIAPYTQGGTREQPVERSSGTILDYLIHKKKYPVEVAGAALISVLWECRSGRAFEGDGSYGSKGRELVTAVRRKADRLNAEKLRTGTFGLLAGAKLAALEEVAFEMVRRQIPWFIRIFAPGSWKWRRSKNESSQRT